ncbi:putative RNA polymerase sigma-70 like domain-containing protein [Lupinus albus]|uniref:Putative RNA polymerase sigma-70 like domain-containing protein n=1 Tax=Lupinus albus TaxID=3870 RepID=A0A6A4R0H7_LUPAL|nr:putative RNA polymerase sigma-70 like domain-containing protein [Lupinus albus]
MATAAVIGLSGGKRLLSSSHHYSDDITEKLFYGSDFGSVHYQTAQTKSVIIAKKSSNYTPTFPKSNNEKQIQSIKALKKHVVDAPIIADQWFEGYNNCNDLEVESSDNALLLLQKSMLEKQWNLSFKKRLLSEKSRRKKMHRKVTVTCSGVSARQRRMSTKRKTLGKTGSAMVQPCMQLRSIISPELLQNRLKGYVKGVVSEELLSHAEVVSLSEKIKVGLSLDEHKCRLKERLGCELSDDQIAISLKISRSELRAKMIECSLARERLTMSNVRLAMSIALRYDNLGAEMADLVQGGLIGLLCGIEKFDSSKGFKISTYVYWWIRQGVSRALAENSRTLRLPTYLHERISLIRNAKFRLEDRGITPIIDRIAKSLNMSQKKVKNATQAINKVISLDREAFPSLNGLPGETHHSYIADSHLENIPWNGVDEWALKDEVNRLINVTLVEREREIIRLYYGLGKECLTWEDISKRIGLSRERVRQVGLVALEKLKHAARKKDMEAMLLN